MRNLCFVGSSLVNDRASRSLACRSSRRNSCTLRAALDSDKAVGLVLLLSAVGTGVILQLRGRDIGAAKAPICLSCKGKGVKPCRMCKGSGVIRSDRARRCEICQGACTFKCQVCNGTGGSA
uniref:Uncharacterized protein n=1 Tax=Timspurckia oligopyrenoides TaxID=708627 RepID=A0A7S0ZE57_9RHOD|mmetsp:Transcript_18/g.34  ORF Transcript_18/g.34 Transcript_18/m.34 type:complete len:122 (+) Transcript_18:88-453(+)